MKNNLIREVSKAFDKTGITRRSFLKLSGIAGVGLVLAATAPQLNAKELGTLVGSGELNAFVQLSSDGNITIYSARPDMGQGVKLSLIHI